MQKHNPYTLPTLDPTEQEKRIILSLESIADTIQDAHGETVEAIAWTSILPIDSEELKNALKNARRCLLTAYNIAEELKHPRHQDER